MSRANLTVRFADGLVLFGIYNGTVDVAFNFLVPTDREAWDRYRDAYALEPSPTNDPKIQEALHPKCTCGGESELVRVETDYGDGAHWIGSACRKCSVFNRPTQRRSGADARSPRAMAHRQLNLDDIHRALCEARGREVSPRAILDVTPTEMMDLIDRCKAQHAVECSHGCADQGTMSGLGPGARWRPGDPGDLSRMWTPRS